MKMAGEVGNGDEMTLPVGKAEVDRVIQENKELFSDTLCKVCSAVLISESQKLAHYQSKKHANKVRHYMSIHQGEEFSAPKKMKMDTVNKESTDGEEDKNKYCTLCNMTFSSPVVALSHYEGKKHSKSLKMKEQGGASDVNRVDAPVAKKVTPPAAKTEEKVVDKSDPEKYCKICSATFTNPQMAQQHYAGKRHKKQETKNKLISVYSSAGNTPRPAKKKNADSPLGACDEEGIEKMSKEGKGGEGKVLTEDVAGIE